MDFKSNQTIVSQIITYMKKQIFSGKLAPGHKIAPIREFAAYCSVNPNTITKAYAALEEEKLIYTDSRSGNYRPIFRLALRFRKAGKNRFAAAHSGKVQRTFRKNQRYVLNRKSRVSNQWQPD